MALQGETPNGCSRPPQSSLCPKPDLCIHHPTVNQTVFSNTQSFLQFNSKLKGGANNATPSAMESTGLRQRRGISCIKTIPLGTREKYFVPDKRVRKVEQDLEKTYDDDFETIVRSEIIAAIDESLSKNNTNDQSGMDSFQILEQEAKKMIDSVEASTARDRFAHKHNAYMKRRQQLFYLLGLLCLVCPMLITFDLLVSLFPANHINVLQYESQQSTTYGKVSRACLNVIRTARSLSQANASKGSAYVSACLGCLAILLLLVRHTTPRRPILTEKQCKRMASIKTMIEEELSRKKALLDTPETSRCSSSL